MTYSGHVTSGGPPDVRELAGLTITKVSVGDMDNNAYLLRCQHTDEQLLIDAAAEPDRLLVLVGTGGLASVVTTHQHWDHIGALADVVGATGASTYAGADDADAITEQVEVPIAHRLHDGEGVTVGQHRLEVITLVGHTPGSVALLYDDPEGSPHLWTGDSLFPGGVGNTFGNADQFRSLIRDVRTKLFDRLPDETWFYPGHGADSTLGAQRPHLDDWESRGW